jgi:hypothetical protein
VRMRQGTGSQLSDIRRSYETIASGLAWSLFCRAIRCVRNLNSIEGHRDLLLSSDKRTTEELLVQQLAATEHSLFFPIDLRWSLVDLCTPRHTPQAPGSPAGTVQASPHGVRPIICWATHSLTALLPFNGL